MAFQVVWTPKARLTHLRNLEYLEQEWSHASAVRFATRVDSVIHLLRSNPRMGKREERYAEEIRSVLSAKHTKLFYQIVGSTIILLKIFDTRQQPGKELE